MCAILWALDMGICVHCEIATDVRMRYPPRRETGYFTVRRLSSLRQCSAGVIAF